MATTTIVTEDGPHGVSARLRRLRSLRSDPHRFQATATLTAGTAGGLAGRPMARGPMMGAPRGANPSDYVFDYLMRPSTAANAPFRSRAG